MNLGVLALVAVAGGVGAGLRALVDALVTRFWPGWAPRGILVVNVTGSFVLGLLTGMSGTVLPPELFTILGTGLLGGYTTFSTVSVETVLLVQRRKRLGALMNLVGTVVLALAAAALGLLLGGLV